MLGVQSDGRLLELAAQGHERAFEVLVGRYRSQLLAHCVRVAGPDRGDDALQLGLLGAWLALQHGTTVRQARPWLYQVAHNAALRTLRGGRDDTELTEVIAGPDSAESELLRRDELREALAALAQLPELQRQALLETAIAGRSYEDVAAELGLRQSTLRGLVARARTSMRGAVTALIPGPLVRAVLARGARGAKPAATAGAGSAGTAGSGGLALSPLIAKGGAVVLAAGALAGGAGVARLVAGPGSAPPASPHASRPVLTRAAAAAPAGAPMIPAFVVRRPRTHPRRRVRAARPANLRPAATVAAAPPPLTSTVTVSRAPGPAPPSGVAGSSARPVAAGAHTPRAPAGQGPSSVSAGAGSGRSGGSPSGAPSGAPGSSSRPVGATGAGGSQDANSGDAQGSQPSGDTTTTSASTTVPDTTSTDTTSTDTTSTTGG